MTERRATEKLYLDDAYEVSFRAVLLECGTPAGGKHAAILDRTCFYPASGGQSADRGNIAGVNVTDVWEDDAGVVYHAVAGALEPGEVDCVVDWSTRFDHMQQHTGQHVLSRAFIDVAGLETCSFHMGTESCTIDLEGGGLTDAVIKEAEALANKVVWEDRDVAARRVPRAEVEGDTLRKSLPDGADEARLVEVGGFDLIGCCGTHVRRTGELGIIKVLKWEKVKKAYRVYFKVGARAFSDYSEKHDIVKHLANRFTTSVQGLGEKIDKLDVERDRHRKSAQKLAGSLASLHKESLLGTARMRGDRRIIVHLCEDCDDDYVKLLSGALRGEKNAVVLLGSPQGLVVCNASAELGVDFSKPVVERARSLGGSGGGKGGFASVRLPDSVSVAEFLEQIYEDIKDL